MSHVEGSISINVSPKAIQAALEDVEHAPEWADHLEKIEDVQGRGKGCTYRWTYKQGIISFSGSTKILESTPGRFIMATTGGIPSTWTWTMLPLDNNITELKLSIEYTVPGSAFGVIADKLVIERQNQKSVVEGLTALKNRLESIRG